MQAKARVVDTQIAVRAAPHCVRRDSGNLLCHHPDVQLVAPKVSITIKREPVLETANGNDVALETHVGTNDAESGRPT